MQEIRHFVSCPILFLTARGEDADKISGFQAGGDDYIAKPFSLHELGARVEAHLRREMRSQTKTSVRFSEDLAIDYSARALYIHDVQIPLAKRVRYYRAIVHASRNGVRQRAYFEKCGDWTAKATAP